MIGNSFECFKCDAPERGDDGQIAQVEDPFQITGTIYNFGARRPSICIGRRTRAAHYGTGNKNIVPRKLDRIEQRLQIVARLVTVKWAARAISTDAARSFADEEHFRFDVAVQLAENGSFIGEFIA